MGRIITLRGEIDAADLGFTSMHEHVLTNGAVFAKWFKSQPGETPVDRHDCVCLENIGWHRRNFNLTDDALSLNDEALMAAELADFRASGGRAIVDMSAPGLRLDVEATRRISEKADVHIVGTTGLYVEDSWPERFRTMSEQQYADYMLAEIRQGMEGTDIRAGHVKVGITSLSAQQERLLRAAARVCGEAGVSMTVHPGYQVGSDGRRILAILLECGLAPGRIIIAHAQQFIVNVHLRRLVSDPQCWGLNLDYCKAILDQGANLSIDCFGHNWDAEALGFVRPTEWQRLAALYALIRQGYSRQLVIGTDTFLKINTRRFGGEGYARLTRFVVPFLRERLDLFERVSQYDLRRITVENPAELLSIQPG